MFLYHGLHFTSAHHLVCYIQTGFKEYTVEYWESQDLIDLLPF